MEAWRRLEVQWTRIPWSQTDSVFGRVVVDVFGLFGMRMLLIVLGRSVTKSSMKEVAHTTNTAKVFFVFNKYVGNRL